LGSPRLTPPLNGDFISPPWLMTPGAIRRRVISMYEGLHSSGIIHNDVEWRHVLYPLNSRTDTLDPNLLCLVDFGRSRRRFGDEQNEKLMDDVKWTRMVGAEMANVLAMLEPR